MNTTQSLEYLGTNSLDWKPFLYFVMGKYAFAGYKHMIHVSLAA